METGLFQFNKRNREALVQNVCQRTCDDYLKKSEADFEMVLEEMIYWKKKRIFKIESFWTQKRKIAYWERYKKLYLKGTRLERQKLLRGSIAFYANQIVGNFSPFVFHLSTRVIPPFLNLLLNALSLQRFLSFSRSVVNENLLVSGNFSWIRVLSQKGTLVFTPTHMSHLDSILVGTALHISGFPPVMYGAGLNLFHNKFIGFFMNNLGAYKVDRLRVHGLYKDVLKEYAACSIEMGFHNLFFPGGTRSRSGTVEKRLKLGLLGATMKAFIRNLQIKKSKANIYIIPVNLNSHLTLEAETLIDDFLAAIGKSRFIIEDDEFSKPQRIFQYVKNHMNLNSKTFVHFGDPLDPFGNQVDEGGVSIDRHGRKIDISRYVKSNGEIKVDDERDRNYTMELSKALIDVFHRNNRVLSTNLVAFTLYEMIARQRLDVYKLLRTYAYGVPIDLKELYREIERVIHILKRLSDQKKIIYSKYLLSKDVQDIVNEALKIFATYHKRKTIYRVGDKIYIGDLLLLYYYHNRLIGYNLEDMMGGIK